MRIHRAESMEPTHTSQAETHVKLGRYALTPKEEHAEEARLEEEREQGLSRERRAKDVTHEAGVVSPVGTEAKLHRDARRNANREGERKDLDPEACIRLVLGITRLIGTRLGKRNEQAQSNGQRHEQEVEYDGQRKLEARQKDHVAK